MNQKLDLLQGTLDLMILRTLLGAASHGHAIAKHIQKTSEELLQVETGSLYPALHRLEAKGWIGVVEIILREQIWPGGFREPPN